MLGDGNERIYNIVSIIFVSLAVIVTLIVLIQLISG